MQVLDERIGTHFAASCCARRRSTPRGRTRRSPRGSGARPPSACQRRLDVWRRAQITLAAAVVAEPARLEYARAARSPRPRSASSACCRRRETAASAMPSRAKQLLLVEPVLRDPQRLERRETRLDARQPRATRRPVRSRTRRSRRSHSRRELVEARRHRRMRRRRSARSARRASPAPDRGTRTAARADSRRAPACARAGLRRRCRSSCAARACARVRVCQHLCVCCARNSSSAVASSAWSVREYGGGEQCGVGRAGGADRERADRNARGHLRDRQQRVEPAERLRLHGHAEHRQRGLRGHHARQVRGAAGARDDDLEPATRGRTAGVLEEQVRRAMRRDDAHFVRRHPSVSRVSAADLRVSQSEVDPMMMPIKGLTAALYTAVAARQSAAGAPSRLTQQAEELARGCGRTDGLRSARAWLASARSSSRSASGCACASSSQAVGSSASRRSRHSSICRSLRSAGASAAPCWSSAATSGSVSMLAHQLADVEPLSHRAALTGDVARGDDGVASVFGSASASSSTGRQLDERLTQGLEVARVRLSSLLLGRLGPYRASGLRIGRC